MGALLEHPKEGKVGLGERLEEPALLERVLDLGMAHVREVGVKENAKEALRHSDPAQRGGVSRGAGSR